MTLKIIKRYLILILGLSIYNGQTLLFAQSNLKEGSNSFALFTKSGDFKNLESARKFSDDAYKTAKDSMSYKNNLLRSLVYSSLAVADSNRKLKYSKDPIEEAKLALGKLKDDNLNFENENQILYIRRKIAHAYQINATRALNNNDYQAAFNSFVQVDAFSNGEIQVKNNLAALSEKLDKKELAIKYYKEYVDSQDQKKPKYFLTLSRLYSETGNDNDAINTLLSGLDIYPNNKNILFEVINIYSDKGIYDAVVPLIDEAISLDPENLELNYLAGYANEVSGSKKMAEHYYKNVIALDKNNYNGNFELGLFYLRDYLNNSKPENKELALTYLLKANEINPSAVNALKALAILFRKAGDTFQYERVQNQLNKDIFN
jgi:tetratricopeptide (TPR) repeat protein